ncbi:mandelate racemase [Cohnella fermenti]|uniref:Mandelate racemase n=2 Tax=Cohnella fermenti TaxID=2565925 RepID=A0A4S4C9I3_9BACL|nr:mandelate racemase [Cohnella fermenti]
MKSDFAISGGAVGNQAEGAPHVYVRIESDTGAVGWGEARPSHRWSSETLESVVSTIEKYLKPTLIGLPAGDLRQIERILAKQIAHGYNAGQPIAKAAVDMALHDLLAVAEGKRLTELWHAPSADRIDLSYLISTSDPEEARAKSAYAKSQGFKGVDVKIGLDPKRDAEIVRAVKEAAPDLFFRVDANQAYSLPEAIRIAKELEAIGIDVFEQPMRANMLQEHALLRRKTDLPIALDESIWTPSDLLQAIRLEACDYAVVKLTKMAGFRGAKLCGEIAHHACLGLLGGGLTESGLGLAASAQLFLALDIRSPVDLNGPFFLADDPIREKPVLARGTAFLPQGLGIGCVPDERLLDRYRSPVCCE